jgi:hypothetical protein
VTPGDPLAREIGTDVQSRAARVIVRVEDQVGRLDPARPEPFPEPGGWT